MAEPHDVLLEQLGATCRVQLIARLHNAEAVGNVDERYLHVFVPDLHLISAAKRPDYQYGFDWPEEFTALTTALLNTRATLQAEGHRMTVTQLGDFVDLWRESENHPQGVHAILESFPDIRDRFLRLAEDAVGPRLLLGNHDLEARQARDFERASMVHYLPGVGGTLLATHGDTFDFLEIVIDDNIATFVLQTFGRLATPQTYPLQTLRVLRDRNTPQDQRSEIQGDATLKSIDDMAAALADRVNVIEVQSAEDRHTAHPLLPNAVKTAEKLRTQIEDDGEPIAPHLKVMVIGHTHHARLIVDHSADLVLMDCGAWIENYRVGEAGEKRPNRQLGVSCGADLRIYQID
jgi:UDP-2,3-diacylglucosamine pyrophosphatase LpxH